jgi:hypothetical protein
MGTQLDKKSYEKLILENIKAIEKYMPKYSLEKNHTIKVLEWSIDNLYPNNNRYTLKHAPIKKESNFLNKIGWLATSVSLIGIIFNSYQNILCWPIWCVANIFWIYWSFKKKNWSQFILWITFTLANIYGWYQWLKI